VTHGPGTGRPDPGQKPPLGVVRVLLGDLRERGLVRVVRAAGRSIPEQSVLGSVLDGLRAP
jgi:hypothetical protein